MALAFNQMLKLVVLVRRREGLSHDELVAHWQNAHMPAVIKHVQPDQYRVTFFDAADDASDAKQYDGMAVLWFKDAEKAKRWYTTADLATELGDGFFEMTDQKPAVLVCEEYVVVDGPRPADAVKVTGLLRRKAEVDADTFYKSWLEDHAPNVSGTLKSTPGGLRYVVSHATLGGSKPEYAGLAEVYYTDNAAASAHMRQLGRDNFLKYTKPAEFLSGTEVVGIDFSGD
jgi:hypothetical protein